MIMFRETYHKWLIFIALIFTLSVLADAPPDAGGWFRLAQEARESGRLDEAREALASAEELGFAPLRIAFERARLHVLAEQTTQAVDELEAIADTGFTAVGFITGDPILRELAGNARYDNLVAEMSKAAYPCENDLAFRAFDFWVGDWEVRGPAGTLAGTNTVERAQRGCVLIENWTSVSGGTGMSVNYFDHAAGEWVQIWNAEGGSQIHIRGGMTDQGMLLTGSLHTVANGETVPFRGLWTPLEDGRVRQFFEQSNDNGATWTPWFEGFYSRKQ
jgi:hypothetical protein